MLTRKIAKKVYTEWERISREIDSGKKPEDIRMYDRKDVPEEGMTDYFFPVGPGYCFEINCYRVEHSPRYEISDYVEYLRGDGEYQQIGADIHEIACYANCGTITPNIQKILSAL